MTEHTGDGGTDATGQADGAEAVEVVDNTERDRFELREAGHVVGIASYAVVPAEGGSGPDRVVFFHTEVRPDHEGRGLAARLASSALDATIASGRSIVALCPYIKAYVARHPEPYAAHVVAPTRADVEAAERAAAVG